MEVFPGAAEELERLESAADIILASPSEVSSESRKEAESLFMSLGNNRISPAVCRYILETSHNSFVLFEIAQLIGATLLKEWPTLEKSAIEETFKFLLKYAAERMDLPHFVRAEIFHSSAKLFKRGIFDGKCGEPEVLCSLIAQLLSGEDQRTQSFGCELIDAIATEFSTSWRGANFGITWDFHFRAKKAFEANGLRQMFELSLRTLHLVANNVDLAPEYHYNLCDKFLSLAESVLSWNFSSRLYPPRLIYCTELNTSAAFRPPKSWSRIFETNEILDLFFKLHSIIRNHESLCKRSLSVLVQLSSLTGDVFENADNILESNSQESYLTAFIRNFMDVFKNGPLEHEVNDFCLVIYKLFTYQKLLVITRIDEEVLLAFLSFIVHYVESFAPIAMQKALQEDDHTFREGLVQVYEAWSVLVRAAHRNQFHYSLHDFTFRILSSFVQNLFSPPIGNRNQLPDKICEEDMDEDDRILFADVLSLVGQFAIFCVHRFLPMIISVFQQKIREFVGYLATNTSLPVSDWREDVHWLFLLIGFSFTEEDIDGTSHLPIKLIEYCTDNAKNNNFETTEANLFIGECIRNPRSFEHSPQICPLMRIVGLTLAWNALDHALISEKEAKYSSPEVSRSALWCTKRFISALSVSMEVDDKDSNYIPKLEKQSEFSCLLTEFTLHRTFAILNRMSGEAKLCIDSVNLLVALAETRASELASNEFLYNCLAGIRLDRLPARRALIRALVLIGASSDNEALQERMGATILRPLADKFHEFSVDASAHESDIIDFLDCFCGVASSAELHSAHILFRFLYPILTSCVSLLSSHSQARTNAVLELFSVVTRKLAVYIDDKDDTISLYRTLLELLEVYQRDQLSKYRTIVINEEEKASDIVLFLDILANIMSKDLLLSAVYIDEEAFDYGSRTALAGLTMLVPLLEEHMLRFPTLCTKFYRLMLYFSEMAPTRVSQMPQQMILSIIEILRLGLQSQFGQEVATISVETVNHLATFFAQDPQTNSYIIAKLSTLIEGTFNLCLEASCQLDVFSEAAFALYALICCNKPAFDNFVNHLLLREQNFAVRNQLEASFTALLPFALTGATRRNKREFRDRLENFLANTQGLLVVN